MARRSTGQGWLAGALGLIALGGCSAIGNPIDALDRKKTAPDEFAVINRDALRVPPGLGTSTLPEPRPGEPSPLEPDPQAEAIAALTGRRDAALTPRSTPISRGEAALLEAADAAAVSPTIRIEIERDKEDLRDIGPYEPPTVVELFTGRSDGVDPGDLIDPVAESRRLQSEGVPTPVDQRALRTEAIAAADAEEEAVEAAEAPRIREPRFRSSNPRSSIMDEEAPGVTIGTRRVLIP